MTEIDDTIMKQMRDQVSDLFTHFDQNSDGEISPEEIKKTLESFGLKRTLDNCKEMIQQTNGGQGNSLNRK
jgi:Ca2+-binding EF-hand superfamily protein